MEGSRREPTFAETHLIQKIPTPDHRGIAVLAAVPTGELRANVAGLSNLLEPTGVGTHVAELTGHHGHYLLTSSIRSVSAPLPATPCPNPSAFLRMWRRWQSPCPRRSVSFCPYLVGTRAFGPSAPSDEANDGQRREENDGQKPVGKRARDFAFPFCYQARARLEKTRQGGEGQDYAENNLHDFASGILCAEDQRYAREHQQDGEHGLPRHHALR